MDAGTVRLRQPEAIVSKRSPILNPRNNDNESPFIDVTKITANSLNAQRITINNTPATGLLQPIPSTFDAEEELDDTSALKKTIDKLRPPRKRKKR